MNKRWAEQKYVIYFLLSVMVLGVCGGVSYGASCCQSGGLRSKGAGLAWAADESDERYVAYTASEQRVIAVEMLAYGEEYDGVQAPNLQVGQVAGGADMPIRAEAGSGVDMAAVPNTGGAAGAVGPAGVETGADAAGNTGRAADAGAVGPAGLEAGAGEAGNNGGSAVESAVGPADVENGADAAGNTGGAADAGAANSAGGTAGGTAGANTAGSAGGTANADSVMNAGAGSNGGAEAAGQNGESTETVPQTEGGAEVQTGGRVIAVSDEDYEALLRIVQAEAGNEDTKGKILVANVVLNRVADERFPNSVYEVVFQRAGGKAQFSPIASGSYYKVVVSDDTIEAVERALAGEDYSEGALFFAARRYAGSSQMRWFDECLTKLFSYGGHEFFTS